MTISRFTRVAVAALVLAVPSMAGAQAKPKADKGTAATPAAPPATPKADLPVPPANFEYSPQGRRDPFLSLVSGGVDPTASKNVKRGEGVAGITTSELSVRGILLTRGAFVAMVSGPDGKVFSVRAGDKLADGVIRTITANSVVIFQEVNDPLSLEKQREVRKFLRSGEEVK